MVMMRRLWRASRAVRPAANGCPPRQVAGPSGHLTKPASGTLAAYTRCVPTSSPVNQHVKVIANLQYVLRAGDDPHSFVYKARRPLQGALP